MDGKICGICGSKDIGITYDGIIRDGGLGKYTDKPIKMWKCNCCDAIWHYKTMDNSEYYESKEYRMSLENTTEEKDFYRLHDKDSLDKFLYTGTSIFRNKVVADIGCGCGAFLDYIKGVAQTIVAIEPSEYYRNIMERKGFKVYPYAVNAIEDFSNDIDVIVSFDVIEHVEDPKEFMKDVYNLLRIGGKAIIGTPTEAPIMRQLLGNDYERKLLFSTQHLWVLGKKNLELISKELGFEDINVRYFQRYGISNLLGWIRDKEPRSDIECDWLTKSIDSVWRSELEEKGMSDYIVLYLTK